MTCSVCCTDLTLPTTEVGAVGESGMLACRPCASNVDTYELFTEMSMERTRELDPDFILHRGFRKIH